MSRNRRNRFDYRRLPIPDCYIRGILWMVGQQVKTKSRYSQVPGAPVLHVIDHFAMREAEPDPVIAVFADGYCFGDVDVLHGHVTPA